DAAPIPGTVKGPDGAPFRGAFVKARNAKTKITVNVLSDNQGRYRVENLTAGDYRLQIRAPGYQADTVNGMALTQEQSATQDFALKQSYVRWTDISMYQGIQLPPEARRQNPFFIHRLPWFRDPHGGGQAQRGWLARPRGLHARGDGVLHRAAAARLQRPEGRGRRLLHQPCVRRGLGAAALAGRSAAIQ